MWACQKALHAISEMTALNQSQLIVKTRRGQAAVVYVAAVAETPQNTRLGRCLEEAE